MWLDKTTAGAINIRHDAEIVHMAELLRQGHKCERRTGSPDAMWQTTKLWITKSPVNVSDVMQLLDYLS